jgi:hypothetical protein
MNKQPPFEPGTVPDFFFKEIESKLKVLNDALAKHQAGARARDLKHIRSKEDLIKKRLFIEKALRLALENQELFPPSFIDKFWEDYDRFLTASALYDSAKSLEKRLLEICPEAAEIPYKTESTTTDGEYNFIETPKKGN